MKELCRILGVRRALPTEQCGRPEAQGVVVTAWTWNRGRGVWTGSFEKGAACPLFAHTPATPPSAHLENEETGFSEAPFCTEILWF